MFSLDTSASSSSNSISSASVSISTLPIDTLLGVTSTSDTQLLALVLGLLLYPELPFTLGRSFSCLFSTDFGLSSSGMPAVLGWIEILLLVDLLIAKFLAMVSGLGESTGAPFNSEGGTAPFLTGVSGGRSLSKSSGRTAIPKLTLFLLEGVPSASISANLLLTGNSKGRVGALLRGERIFSPIFSGLFS